ncbi:unnamed protein product [Prorocentrum cordatum]|uniref:Uncharacterized protein n=1 Tax=Prorocentrum cordatum TaxID=2364126 RepID=A0ABN9STM5_9DINO|nr:unnamed protein product [Polarella glacialis]
MVKLGCFAPLLKIKALPNERLEAPPSPVSSRRGLELPPQLLQPQAERAARRSMAELNSQLKPMALGAAARGQPASAAGRLPAAGDHPVELDHLVNDLDFLVCLESAHGVAHEAAANLLQAANAHVSKKARGADGAPQPGAGSENASQRRGLLWVALSPLSPPTCLASRAWMSYSLFLAGALVRAPQAALGHVQDIYQIAHIGAAKYKGGIRLIGLSHCPAAGALLARKEFHDLLVGATAGRGSDRLVWAQSAMTEWRQERAHASAPVFLDSEKALEQIAHSRLLQAAVAAQIPIRQLRLPTHLYRALRIPDLDGRVSQVVNSLQSAMVGCHFTAIMLQLAVLQPLDIVPAVHRTAHHGVVVGDFGSRAHGRAAHVLERVVGAAELLREELSRADLRTERSKSAVLRGPLSGPPGSLTGQVAQFRGRVKPRLMVIARLAIQAARAKKPDEELKEDMSMLKYALDQTKPFGEVKAEQVARLASKMEDLKNTKCRIATLEAQVGELEYDTEDTKTALAETEARIAAELHDIIPEPAGAEMAVETMTTAPRAAAAAQAIAALQEQSRHGTTAYAQLQYHSQQLIYQMQKMQQYMQQLPGGQGHPMPDTRSTAAVDHGDPSAPDAAHGGSYAATVLDGLGDADGSCGRSNVAQFGGKSNGKGNVASEPCPTGRKKAAEGGPASFAALTDGGVHGHGRNVARKIYHDKHLSAPMGSMGSDNTIEPDAAILDTVEVSNIEWEKSINTSQGSDSINLCQTVLQKTAGAPRCAWRVIELIEPLAYLLLTHSITQYLWRSNQVLNQAEGQMLLVRTVVRAVPVGLDSEVQREPGGPPEADRACAQDGLQSQPDDTASHLQRRAKSVLWGHEQIYEHLHNTEEDEDMDIACIGRQIAQPHAAAHRTAANIGRSNDGHEQDLSGTYVDRNGQEQATLVLSGSVVSATYPPGSRWDPESGTLDGSTIHIFGLRGTYRDGQITWAKNGSVWTRRPRAAESPAQTSGPRAWDDNGGRSDRGRGKPAAGGAEQHAGTNGAAQAAWQAPAAARQSEPTAAAASCPSRGARAAEAPADPEDLSGTYVDRNGQEQATLVLSGSVVSATYPPGSRWDPESGTLDGSTIHIFGLRGTYRDGQITWAKNGSVWTRRPRAAESPAQTSGPRAWDDNGGRSDRGRGKPAAGGAEQLAGTNGAAQAAWQAPAAARQSEPTAAAASCPSRGARAAEAPADPEDLSGTYVDRNGQEQATLVLSGSVVSATYPPGSRWDPESGTLDGSTIHIFGLRGTYRDGQITWAKNGSVWTRRPRAAESPAQTSGPRAWDDNGGRSDRGRGKPAAGGAEQLAGTNGAAQAAWQAPAAARQSEPTAAAASCPSRGARAAEAPADPEDLSGTYVDQSGQEQATLVLSGSVVSATYPPGSRWDPESGTLDGSTIHIFGLRGTYRDGQITWAKNGSVWTRRPRAAESPAQTSGPRAWDDNGGRSDRGRGKPAAGGAEQHAGTNGAAQAAWQAPAAARQSEPTAAAASCPSRGARAAEAPADPEDLSGTYVDQSGQEQATLVLNGSVVSATYPPGSRWDPESGTLDGSTIHIFGLRGTYRDGQITWAKNGSVWTRRPRAAESPAQTSGPRAWDDNGGRSDRCGGRPAAGGAERRAAQAAWQTPAASQQSEPTAAAAGCPRAARGGPAHRADTHSAASAAAAAAWPAGACAEPRAGTRWRLPAAAEAPGPAAAAAVGPPGGAQA